MVIWLLGSIVRTDTRCARIRPNGARDAIEQLSWVSLEDVFVPVPLDGRGATSYPPNCSMEPTSLAALATRLRLAPLRRVCASGTSAPWGCGSSRAPLGPQIQNKGLRLEGGEHHALLIEFNSPANM